MNFLQRKAFSILGSFLLCAMLFVAVSQNATSQNRPRVPKLSLTGQDGGFDDDWYPDGRIWLPPSANGDREFLLPVWIENRWANYAETPQFDVKPVFSFFFKILYDSSAIRAVGVQKFGPRDEDNGYEPLAKHFNISWHDTKETERYKTYLFEEVQYQDKQKGRVIRITGTSGQALPNTDLGSEEWKILLYVRFKVIPKVDVPFGESGRTPIYIDNDTIMYDDINLRTQNPFQKELENNIPGAETYQPGTYTGLGGIDNIGTGVDDLEPYKPGVIWLRLSDRVPELELRMERGIGQVPALEEISSDLWNVQDPITIDSASFNPIWGTRKFRITNRTPQSRLLDLYVESDQPWLKMQCKPEPQSNDRCPADFSSPTTEGWINWIDNGILGEGGFRDPEDRATDDDGDIQLEIQCDPNAIEATNSEKTGVYVGYITFRSTTMGYTPVRMRVTFIYFRNPEEWFDPIRDPGIKLIVRNSCGQVGDSTALIFGTGHRATDDVDSLFGEFAWNEPMEGFGARFFPVNPAIDDVPFGFGDWSPNDEKARTTLNAGDGQKQYGSRDIRSNTDTLQSIVYKVRFNAGGDNCYPLVIEWNTRDFPEGSQLFLRDTVNGSHFNVDMRKATNLGNGRFSYSIYDPRWTSFYIEYTLPHVIRYVDNFNNPIIKNGWNLLSLPVRPTDNYWNSIYNSKTTPIKFNLSIYQNEEYLHPGVGYFVKYPSDYVDTVFTGTFISRIANPMFEPLGSDIVRLYDGWNTIGSVSMPINVSTILLDPFDDNNRPDVQITLEKGIFGYVTDRGYEEVSEMMPGLGYWAYVDKGAYLNLKVEGPKISADDYAATKKEIIDRSTKIILRDNAQHESNIYMTENDVSKVNFMLPPLPPLEMYDVRFNSGGYLETANNAVINMQAVIYPVSLTIKNADMNYTFKDPISGEVFGTIEAGQSGNVVIDNTSNNSVQILKSVVDGADFALSSYPNPISGISTVKYSIPADEHVIIKLYDAMGKEVMSLLDDYRTANSYDDVQINSSELSSGTYILKLTAGNQNLIQTVTVVK